MKCNQIILMALTVFFVLMTAVTAFAQEGRPRLGLGVSPLQASPLLLQHLRLSEGEGLMVNNVAVGSELEAAGLSQGDIVLAIDGHALSRPSDLTSYLSQLPSGKQVTLDVIQKGEHRQIYLKLDNLPDEIVWKYVQPVTGPGRSGRSGLGFGQRQPRVQLQQIQPQGGNKIMGSQYSTIHSMMSTPDGIKTYSVTVNGSPDDPDTELEITIGSDTYKSTIKDLSQLPEDAQNAARNAIDQMGSFSFGFGSMPSGSSFMDEMMKRHQEQMRMMDEMMDEMFRDPSYPGSQPREQPKNNGVLRPVEPDKSDIQS